MVTTNVIAELCIYIFTWNVGTHSPDVSFADALGMNTTSPCPDKKIPDIYVLGFQEVSVKPKNQILDIFQDNPWTFKVKNFLDSYEYVKIETKQLQGLLIMLFSQSRHIPNIKEIETESTKTGLGGLWGNKGAVSIRMTLYNTGVTFVVAHLAAHDHELKERIEDYNQIVNNHHYKLPNFHTIFDHDLIIWFGDLNFRLTGTDSAWDVRNSIEQNNLSELIQRDQLLLVRETGNAFSLLEENLPTFPPTFKYVKGSSEYDLKRRPAWCDRILFRVDRTKYADIALSLEQLSYRSHPDYTHSDHKPVSSTFLYKIKSSTKSYENEYKSLSYTSAPCAIL